ncbi:hypothetical protein BGW80DRAFT_1251638 [Lactifluus volemus]|nr:hypothetical protein BGW80DRAFT_1251638 [Lactifluus volemus]
MTTVAAQVKINADITRFRVVFPIFNAITAVHTPRQVSKLERPLNASRRFNSAKVENVTVVSHRKSVSEGNETSDQVKLAPTGPASRFRRLWSVVWAIQSLFHGARSGPGNLHTFTTLRIRLIERLKLSTYLMGEFSKMMDWRDGIRKPHK